MFFSVIIPLYNKAAYIQAAIDSVLQQSFVDFEIIVVDDGSRDDGAAVVRACTDPRVRLLSQANGGVSRARNAGIDAARGTLVCFLDADDWYGRGYLQAIHQMWQKHPEHAFYAAGFLRIPDGAQAQLDGELAPASPGVLLDNFFEYRHRHGFFFCTNSVAVPRAALLDMKPCFPLGDQFGEDQDLWFRLAERLQLVFTPSRLVAYRVGLADSLCATQGLQSLPPVFDRLEQRVRAGMVPAPQRAAALRIVSDAHLAVARQALLDGRRSAAWAEWHTAGAIHRSKKWLVTLLMCIIGSKTLLRKWELWRAAQISA